MCFSEENGSMLFFFWARVVWVFPAVFSEDLGPASCFGEDGGLSC